MWRTLVVCVSVYDVSDTRPKINRCGWTAEGVRTYFLSREEITVGELIRNRESASPRFCTKDSEL